jgi:hypothetical protein
MTRLLSDTVTLSDNLTELTSFFRSLADTIAISEDLQREASLLRGLADFITLSDAATVAIAIALFARDICNPTILETFAERTIGLIGDRTIGESDLRTLLETTIDRVIVSIQTEKDIKDC